MFSPSRKLDKEFLLEITLLIEQLIKNGSTAALDLAEKFGENYLALQNKISTYDYTTDDRALERFNSIMK
jgi:hypothetical protein